MSIYDEDPISALSCLNDATAKYNEAKTTAKAARDNEAESLRILNAHQVDFDRLAKRLRKIAPAESMWGQDRDNPF